MKKNGKSLSRLNSQNILALLIVGAAFVVSVPQSLAATVHTPKKVPAKAGKDSRALAKRKSFARVKGAEQLRAEYKSFFNTLPSERDIPELRPLVEKMEQLPRQVWLVPTWDDSTRVDLAVNEIGYGTNANVIVAIHGVLATHESWRYLVGALSGDFDFWLVDLPGCGQSEKPAPAKLGPNGFTPEAMGARVWQAIAAMLVHRQDSPRLTLMAHSLGGLVTIRMMADPTLRQEYEQTRQLVAKLVLLAPCDSAVGIQIQNFIQIAELGSWKISVGQALGLVREQVARADHDSFGNSAFSTRESAQVLLGAFVDGNSFRAAQAMIRQAVPGWSKNRKPDWDAISKKVAEYHNVDVPCLIIWGERDETLPEWMGHKIKDHITGSILEELPSCKHSAALECPQLCADLVREFHARSTASLIAATPVSAVGSVRRFSH